MFLNFFTIILFDYYIYNEYFIDENQISLETKNAWYCIVQLPHKE